MKATPGQVLYCKKLIAANPEAAAQFSTLDLDNLTPEQAQTIIDALQQNPRRKRACKKLFVPRGDDKAPPKTRWQYGRRE